MQQKGKESEVEATLQAIEGVDVHHVTDNSRLVVTVELDGKGQVIDTMDSFRDIPGVVSTVLTYQHSEEV